MFVFFVGMSKRSQRSNVQKTSMHQATVAEHYGLAPSARGYRFGNHPMTRGPVRFGFLGTDFAGSGKRWYPSSHNHGSGKWAPPILVSFHLG